MAQGAGARLARNTSHTKDEAQMSTPTQRDQALDERERLASDREQELTALAGAQDDREVELDKREAELDKGEAELNERREAPPSPPSNAKSATIRAEAVTAADDGLTYSTLPEPRAGNGHVVIETETDLVTILAHLHPSERETVCAQISGAIRHTLRETGRLQRARPAGQDDQPASSLAILPAAAP